MSQGLRTISVTTLALALCFAGITGCGGGGSTGTTTTPTPPTPTGPQSGSEFLYSTYFAADVQVATVDPSTGALSTFKDATPALFPQITESSGIGTYRNFLFVAGFNQVYAAQNLWSFSITGKNGELTNLSIANFEGGNILIDKRNGHLYSVGVSLDNNDNQIMTIYAYVIDPNSGTVSIKSAYTKNGFQGSFLAPTIDPLGRFYYAWEFTPAGLSVFVYAIDSTTGALAEAQGSPFLVFPITADPTLNVAQLFPSPSGNFLNLYYQGSLSKSQVSAGNLVVMSVDPVTGSLSVVSGSPFPLGSAYPNPIAMSNSGKWLYVPTGSPTILDECTDSTAIFAIDLAQGTVGAGPVTTTSGGFGCDEQVDPLGQLLVSTRSTGTELEAWSSKIDESTGSITAVKGSPFTLPEVGATNPAPYEYSSFVKIP